MTKQCARCYEFLPLDRFSLDNARPDKLSYQCRACQKERREELKLARLNHKLSSLNATMKKVYEGVPIQEAWSVADIHASLYRQGIRSLDKSGVRGCLAHMARAGVIREPEYGYFVRVLGTAPEETKHEPETEQTTEKEDMAEAPQPAVAESPIEKISKLSAQAQTLITAVKKLAADIDTVAIEVEDMFASRDAQTQKLRQLQTLLKELA